MIYYKNRKLYFMTSRKRYFFGFFVICFVFLFLSCKGNFDKYEEQTYRVFYSLGAGISGEPPVDENSYYAGQNIVLPWVNNQGDFYFEGWMNGNDLYRAGESYRFGTSDVTFVANWSIRYSYDKNNGSDKDKKNTSIFPDNGYVDAPTFSVYSRTVSYGTEVELSCVTECADIYYTTDESVPNSESTKYENPIVITSNVLIKAIAYKTGMNRSNVASRMYEIEGMAGMETVSTPVFSVDEGEVAGGTPLGITCGTSGATIYYTTDGSTPTASSSVYSSPINIDAAMTVKAIAVKSGMNDSAVASASYTLTPTGTDYSTCVIGDIILKDGSICSVDDYVTGSNTAAAVIVRAAADGKPALGVGIVHKLSQIEWCKSATSNGQQSITALVGNATSGYMDGSNSWDLLVEACYDLKNATAETIETVAQDYPAWNYCRTYAETNGLTGDLADGWYLPTVAELKTINQNKTVVNTSLSKAGGDSFGGTDYWSCNQASTSNYARFLDFSSNSTFQQDKKNGAYVCAVRAFN